MVRQIKIYIILLLLAAGSPLWAQPVRPCWLKDVTSASLKSATSASVKSAVEKAARQALVPTQEALTKSIFRAYPQGEEGTHALSGFTFKTKEGEMFGVIAQHIMPTGRNGGRVLENFTARVIYQGQEIDIPATVVQMSSPYMLDVALVKFHPKDENLFTPLTLAEQEPEPGDKLYTIGYGAEQLTFLADKPLTQNTLVSLRFPLGPYRRISGLCGSPVLNEQGEVVGSFTGGKYLIEKKELMGFATKSSYLPALVREYHEKGKITFPLMLEGYKIFDLQVNEHISHVWLEDDAGNRILYLVTPYNFPYNAIVEQLPNTRYIKLGISSHMNWNGRALIDTDFMESYFITYDWKEKKIIRENQGGW